MQEIGDLAIRVGVIDDHGVVRAGLRALINSEADLCLVGDAADGSQALELVKHRAPDVLILDIDMPGPDPVQLVGSICHTDPACKVVLYSAFPEQQYAPTLQAVGARGFVDKAAPVSELLEAIRAVADGGTVFSSVTLNSGSEKSAVAPAAPLAFTAREFQIFLKLAAGQLNMNVAADLGISTQTVSIYRGRVLKKLGLKTNMELTRYAIENGFLKGTVADF